MDLTKEMMNMLIMNATDVRKDWSAVIDNVVRIKPQFFKRTRDCLMLTDVRFLLTMLSAYQFTATIYKEEDNTVTISLNEIDLVENAETEELAKQQLAESIMEYAEDYYDDFAYWSSASNRVEHVPYVIKALILNDAQQIGEQIVCQSGKS
jgi:predicted RNase H-like HicB family nuclease